MRSSAYISCFLLSTLFLLYGIQRYNGWDLNSYFELAEALYQQTPIYGQNLKSLYPPPTVYLFEILRFLPKQAVHFIWYLISVGLFVRMSIVSFSILGDASWPQKKVTVWLWLSWITIAQGLGAQLEGGNVNLFLMFLLLESFNLVITADKSSTSERSLSVGLVLAWIPVFFKPYLGILAVALTSAVFKKQSWRPLIQAGSFLAGLSLISIFWRGIPLFIHDVSSWLQSDLKHVDCAFTLQCNAVNYGLPSYLYHIHHWSLKSVSLLTLATTILSLLYAGFEKNNLRMFCVLSLVSFCISPAAFPYTLLLLWVPIVVSCRMVVNKKSCPRWVHWGCVLFVLALIGLNPTYLGRHFFNAVVVPYRVTTFFILLGVIPIFGAVTALSQEDKWRRERDSNSR